MWHVGPAAVEARRLTGRSSPAPCYTQGTSHGAQSPDVVALGKYRSIVPGDFDRLHGRLRAFTEFRGWQHHHTVKNLVLALTSEVGELATLVRWCKPEAFTALHGSAVDRARIESEMADVLIFLLYLADATGVDLLQATEAKIDLNETRDWDEQEWDNAGSDVGDGDPRPAAQEGSP